MIEQSFDYFRPKTFNQLFELMSENKGAHLLAGGTDLTCNLKENFVKAKSVIDLKAIKGLDKIKFSKGVLSIGSLVTFTQIIESEIVKVKFPLIYEAALTVASVAIRNRATMVGNICSAVPCLDSGGAMMVYEADVVVRSEEDERVVPANKWFKAPRKTAIKKGELVTAINFKVPSKKSGSAFVKLRRYQGEDLAQASVAVLLFGENEYRIAFGSVGPIPIRAKKIESLLKGEELSENIIMKAKQLVEEEISPITDIRATKEYRMHMCKVMLGRALSAASMRLENKGPDYGDSLI